MYRGNHYTTTCVVKVFESVHSDMKRLVYNTLFYSKKVLLEAFWQSTNVGKKGKDVPHPSCYFATYTWTLVFFVVLVNRKHFHRKCVAFFVLKQQKSVKHTSDKTAVVAGWSVNDNIWTYPHDCQHALVPIYLRYWWVISSEDREPIVSCNI